MVDGGLVVDDGDGLLGAGVDAPGGNTAPAGGAYLDLGHRTLVTGDLQPLGHTGVGAVPSQSHLHPLGDNGPLLINAAAHLGLGAGDDLLWHIQDTGGKAVLPGQFGHRPQYIVLQFLDRCFKLSHTDRSFGKELFIFSQSTYFTQ